MLIVTRRKHQAVPLASNAELRAAKAELLDALRLGSVRIQTLIGLRAAMELYEDGLIAVEWREGSDV